MLQLVAKWLLQLAHNISFTMVCQAVDALGELLHIKVRSKCTDDLYAATILQNTVLVRQ